MKFQTLTRMKSTAAVPTVTLLVLCLHLNVVSGYFTNRWAVHITGGEGAARRIAGEQGFTYISKVSFDKSSFRLRSKPWWPSVPPGRLHNLVQNKNDKHIFSDMVRTSPQLPTPNQSTPFKIFASSFDLTASQFLGADFEQPPLAKICAFAWNANFWMGNGQLFEDTWRFIPHTCWIILKARTLLKTELSAFGNVMIDLTSIATCQYSRTAASDVDCCCVSLQIMDDYYELEHHRISKRSIEAAQTHHASLENHPEIHWVEQQTVKKRVKRDFLEEEDLRDKRDVIFNDPKWIKMWYLVSFLKYEWNFVSLYFRAMYEHMAWDTKKVSCASEQHFWRRQQTCSPGCWFETQLLVWFYLSLSPRSTDPEGTWTSNLPGSKGSLGREVSSRSSMME